MGDMDDLFTALKMFKGGVQELQFKRTLASANEQVQQIKASEANEQEQRAQLQAVANQLTMQMAGLGIPATTMAQVTGAVGPKQFDSAGAMLLEGVQSGNQGLIGQAKEAIQIAGAPAAAEKERERKHEMDKLRMTLAAQERMTGARIGASAAAAKAPKAEDVAFQTNINVARTMIKDLAETVRRSGTWESPYFGDSKDAAVLQGTPYQLAITYAKIVDPNSVARESEVAAAQEYLFPMGIATPKARTLEQLGRLKLILKRYEQERAKAKGGVMKSPLTGAMIPIGPQEQTTAQPEDPVEAAIKAALED